MKRMRYILFLSLLMNALVFDSASAQIQIDSVTTDPSTCPNNGSIEVHARGGTPPLLYSITAGPALQPVQTSSTFNSLPAGNYTVEVSDGSGHQTDHNITVSGNYTPLDFSPKTSDPHCSGSSDGQIKGNLIPGTGNGAYTWELITPSPVTAGPQASETFDNLPAGNYTVRVTDGCGNFRTRVTTLNDPVTTLTFMGPKVMVTGCDTVRVWMEFLSPEPRFPFTYQFETKNGTFTTTNSTLTDTAGNIPYFNVQQILPGISYGDSLKVTITDACGKSVSDSGTVSTFSFCPEYINTYVNCNYKVQPDFHLNLNNAKCFEAGDLFTAIKGPLKYQLTESGTNIVADSGTIESNFSHWTSGITSVEVKPVDGNKHYDMLITDGCGNTFTESYFIGAPNLSPTKVVKKEIHRKVCFDSVASASIDVATFKTKPLLILLSGPSSAVSSRPDYEYSGSYTYPDTLLANGKTDRLPNYTFEISSLYPGTYQFKVIDSCGSEVYDSLEVKPGDVSRLDHNFSFEKGCLGQNKIHYSVTSWMGNMSVQSISSPAVSWFRNHMSQNNDTGVIADSILNVPPGIYELSYSHGYGSSTSVPGITCSVITDTIIIPDYEAPEITTGNNLLCNNTVSVELIPDSAKGVAPYQYEIISGPKTFPVQGENVFNLDSGGIYTARVYDNCGNASTTQISVGTNSVSPVTAASACNNARIIYPSSSFYTYEWERPDGSRFAGDSLILESVSPADTGTYHVSQIINLNGCVDTLYSSHIVSLSSIYQKNLTICAGDSVKFGLNTYYSTGIYTDTLQSSAGCDSIIQLDLTVSAYKSNTIQETICPGGSLTIAGKIYSSPGTYYDTLATTTCDSILRINLSTAPVPQVDLGKDSSLCQGQSLVLDAGSGHAVYFWNDNMVDSVSRTYTAGSAGKYWVRVENQQGCSAEDTVEILNMYPLPTADAGDDVNICPGDSVHLSASGGDYYQWSPIGTGQADIIVSPDITTTYSVTATDGRNCSSVADEVTVHVNPVSLKPVFKTGQVGHCFNEGPLGIEPEWGESFFWPVTGDTTKEILVTDEGTYTVKVTDGSGCPVTGELVVENKCTSGIYVPDAFSPNSDGLHDELEIFGAGFRDFDMKVFNRWGEIIFISSDRSRRWDGRYLGKMMPVGNYPWIIHYRSSESEKMLTKRGSVTLVR